jgi:hypothetical protein
LKIAICEEEGAETEHWLELAWDANLVALTPSEELLPEVQELLAVFVASARSAKSGVSPQ